MTGHDDNREQIRSILSEWAETPSPMSAAIEEAILKAPMPDPNGKPPQKAPRPESNRQAPLEQRLLPAAKVEHDPITGRMGPIRYRADLAKEDEVAYDQ